MKSCCWPAVPKLFPVTADDQVLLLESLKVHPDAPEYAEIAITSKLAPASLVIVQDAELAFPAWLQVANGELPNTAQQGQLTSNRPTTFLIIPADQCRCTKCFRLQEKH